MTHDGHSAARISGACFVMGQAAGTAAALALARGCTPHELPARDLQRRLVEQGAFLGDPGSLRSGGRTRRIQSASARDVREETRMSGSATWIRRAEGGP